MAPRILYVVTEDWYFLSHRLPMARAAKAAGYEVHVAARLKDGRAGIEAEGFTVHALDWSRGSLSLRDSLAAIRQLRRLFHAAPARHRPQCLAEAGRARLGGEPRPAARHRQQPDRRRLAVHRRSQGERARAPRRALRPGASAAPGQELDRGAEPRRRGLRARARRGARTMWSSSGDRASTRSAWCRCRSRRRRSPAPMSGACSPTRACRW